MQTSTYASYAAPSIPLHASPLDPNEERVLLLEFVDPNSDEGWRIFSLIDGSYVFELQAYDIVLLSEHHLSVTDATARVDRWQRDRLLQKAA